MSLFINSKVGLVEENGTNWGHGEFCTKCGQALDWSD